jgi:tetratricopeptide (TPR) repeat protein
MWLASPRLLAIGLFIGAQAMASAAHGQESWVGKKVMPKTVPVKIGHTNEKGQQVFVGEIREIVLVLKEEGGWLKVRSRGTEGWFDKDKAVLLDDAPAYFTDVIRAKPNDAWPWGMRGAAWLAKGEFDNAIKDLTEAIRLEPNGAVAFYNRGRAWRAKKEYDKAIRDYDEAIRLDPKDAFAFNNRGSAWRDKKDYDKAIKDFDETIRLDPKYAVGFNNRGEAWSNKKEYEKAIKDFDEAIRLDPKHSWFHITRSTALMLDRRPGAADGFQNVLQLGWKGTNPQYAVILGNFAARQAGDEARAKQFLRDSTGKLDDAWPIAAVRFLNGEIEESELLKLATDEDKRTEAHCYLGLDHALRGRKDQAIAHFRWVKEHGNTSFVEYTIAVAELERLEKGNK